MRRVTSFPNSPELRRYEGATSRGSLDVLRNVAVALPVSTDALVFDDDERALDERLRLQFEATTRLDDDEKDVIRTVIEGILLKHEARRWATPA